MKIVLIICLLLLASCSSEDNNPYNPSGEQTYVSIAYLRSLYSGSVVRIADDLYIEAYLVSNDSEGNNYHTLSFQDSSQGIDIKVDLDDSQQYFTTFNCYRISVQGLCVGGSSDNVSLGISTGYYYVEDIPEDVFSGCITDVYGDVYDSATADVIDVSLLKDSYLGRYVMLSNVSYSYDEGHYLTCLTTQRRILLDVSTYADFHDALTQQSGTCAVLGVVGKSDGEYSIRPSFASDVCFF